jgi:hypothetical protein
MRMFSSLKDKLTERVGAGPHERNKGQNGQSRVIGARISYYDLGDTSIEGINFAPDSTALFEGNLTYFYNKMFSLDFGVG